MKRGDFAATEPSHEWDKRLGKAGTRSTEPEDLPTPRTPMRAGEMAALAAKVRAMHASLGKGRPSVRPALPRRPPGRPYLTRSRPTNCREVRRSV